MRTGIRSLLFVAAIAGTSLSCSPIYVLRAGWEEAKILSRRKPIATVLADPATADTTRRKLTLVTQARDFAERALGLAAGDSYTTYSFVDSDTLLLVLSAARKDRFEPYTWWFPIVGRVPYKGFFDFAEAHAQAARLDREGWDTYVRPSGAFSTLGWFNDPLLSTVLRTDDVEVVETVLHELSHQHLFVPGHVDFNESFATFVGRVGAIRFFCTRAGGGPASVRCQRAQARWRDYQRFSVFIDELRTELERVYYLTAGLTYEDKLRRREEIFAEAQRRFAEEVQPTFEAFTFQSFLTTPLNNATLLARIRYYKRLPDFDALLDLNEGDLPAVLADLRARARTVSDPFELLPRGAPGQP